MWLYRRVKYELVSPKLPTIKYLVKRREILRGLFSAKKIAPQINMFCPDTLLAVYDLNSSPITFDFCHFLAAADSYGKMNEKSKIFVFIVQRDLDSFPLLEDNSHIEAISEDSESWRLNNIIFQLTHLYANCIGYSFVPCGSEMLNLIPNQLVYPAEYSHSYKPSLDYVEIFKLINLKLFRGFEAPKQGLNYIYKWQKLNNILNPMVVITLRQSGYDVARNSNIEERVKFAHWVKGQGFTPIIVPDTDACWVPNNLLDDFIVFNEPSWNLGLRMALNELAFVNLFYLNGPASICSLSKKPRSILFFPIIEETIHCNSATFKEFGLTNGQRRYDFAEPHQFLSWKRDSFENIQDEFMEFQKYYPLD